MRLKWGCRRVDNLANGVPHPDDNLANGVAHPDESRKLGFTLLYEARNLATGVPQWGTPLGGFGTTGVAPLLRCYAS